MTREPNGFFSSQPLAHGNMAAPSRIRQTPATAAAPDVQRQPRGRRAARRLRAISGSPMPLTPDAASPLLAPATSRAAPVGFACRRSPVRPETEAQNLAAFSHPCPPPHWHGRSRPSGPDQEQSGTHPSKQFRQRWRLRPASIDQLTDQAPARRKCGISQCQRRPLRPSTTPCPASLRKDVRNEHFNAIFFPRNDVLPRRTNPAGAIHSRKKRPLAKIRPILAQVQEY